MDNLPNLYEIDDPVKILKEAFEEHSKKKFNLDQKKMDNIMQLATGDSALGILRSLRELDDDVK